MGAQERNDPDPQRAGGGDDGPAPRAKCRRRLPGRALRCLQWTVNLLVLLALVMVFTPAGDWVGQRLIRVDPLSKADYIVVLDGDRERAAEAWRLYRHGWAPKVIVSSKRQGAKSLAELVADLGVPAEAVLIDPNATRTSDHPASVAALSGVDRGRHRFIVVTSLYHTSRSRACFARGGYRHIIMRPPAWRIPSPPPHAWLDWTGRASDCYSKTYEVLAWAYYKAAGRL